MIVIQSSVISLVVVMLILLWLWKGKILCYVDCGSEIFRGLDIFLARM